LCSETQEGIQPLWPSADRSLVPPGRLVTSRDGAVLLVMARLPPTGVSVGGPRLGNGRVSRMSPNQPSAVVVHRTGAAVRIGLIGLVVRRRRVVSRHPVTRLDHRPVAILDSVKGPMTRPGLGVTALRVTATVPGAQVLRARPDAVAYLRPADPLAVPRIVARSVGLVGLTVPAGPVNNPPDAGSRRLVVALAGTEAQLAADPGQPRLSPARAILAKARDLLVPTRVCVRPTGPPLTGVRLANPTSPAGMSVWEVLGVLPARGVPVRPELVAEPRPARLADWAGPTTMRRRPGREGHGLPRRSCPPRPTRVCSPPTSAPSFVRLVGLPTR